MPVGVRASRDATGGPRHRKKDTQAVASKTDTSARQPPIATTRAVVNLAWPLTVNAILLQSAVIIDTYLVSTLGEAALAAMGLAAALGGLLLGALVALSQATQILVARAKGADDALALKSALACAAAIGGVIAGGGAVLVWTWGDDLIAGFAHTPEIAALATGYINIFVLVILSEVGSQALSCYFNGTGRTKFPLYSLLIQMPVNVALSILLIFGLYGFPELGLQGAAIGSAAAAVLRLGFLSLCVLRQDRGTLRVSGWSRGSFGATTRAHFVFTLPVAAQFFGIAASNAVCALIYARMAITDFAAMTLVLPWVQVVGVMMISWSQASGIMVGQALGQRASDADLTDFLKRAWRVSVTLAGVVSLLFLAASFGFQWIYADLQQATLDALWSFVPALLFLSFPKSSNAMCGTTLRAGGDTIHVMKIHLTAQWVYRVPLTALLVLYLEWSVTWVFSLLLFEELLKFPFFHGRFFGGKWRRMMDPDGEAM